MKKQRIKVLGGMVTYNPDITRLKENLSTLCNQVDKLYVFDNGSKNILEIKNVLKQYCSTSTLFKNKSNAGIAYALENIMEYAAENDFNWVLSIDQDSVLDSNLVKKYKDVVLHHNENDIGMLTCLIKDRNFKDNTVETQTDELKEVPICITSAAFTNVKNYFSTSGYDPELFIDLVDTDICLTLRENDFKILRINYLGVYHEIGHGENKHLLWKNIIVHHSSVFREYYMARNSILLHKKHPKLYPSRIMIKGLILNLLTIVFFESNKGKRLSNYFKGIKSSILILGV